MKRQRGIVLTVVLGVALGPFDTAVNTAFPAITQAFALPIADIQWIAVCYLLTYASLLLNCGRWADLYGYRSVFIAGVICSAIGLSLCALASSYSMLLVFRVLQGIGTALILAVAPALLTQAYPDQQRSRAVAIYGLAFSAAYALGPILGGYLTHYWGWPAVFWFRVPLALLALLSGLLLLDEEKQSIAAQIQAFDRITGISLSAFIVLALLSLNQLSVTDQSVLSFTVMLATALCAGIVIYREKHSPTPFIESRLWRKPLFLIANISHMLCQLAAFSVFVLCPYYFSIAFPNDIVLAGIILALSPLGMMLGSALVTRLDTVMNAQQICCLATLLLGAGLFSIAYWDVVDHMLWIVIALLLHGIGLGLFQVANMDFVMQTMAANAQGVAGSLVMLMRTSGVVAGASISAILLTYWQTQSPVSAAEPAFLYAFHSIFLAAAVLVAFVFVLLLSTQLGPHKCSSSMENK